MPALVVAQHAELALERRRLLVPHRTGGAKRVGEREPGRALGPVDRGVEIDAVRLDAHGAFNLSEGLVTGLCEERDVGIDL